MVSFNSIQAQLVKTDAQVGNVGVEDVKALAYVLAPSEQIMVCLKGILGRTTGTLCATDKRLLFVNKKDNRMVVVEVSYESISDIVHFEKGWSAHILVTADNNVHQFRSWRKRQAKDAHMHILRHLSYVRELSKDVSESTFVVPKKFARLARAA